MNISPHTVGICNKSNTSENEVGYFYEVKVAKEIRKHKSKGDKNANDLKRVIGQLYGTRSSWLYVDWFSIPAWYKPRAIRLSDK